MGISRCLKYTSKSSQSPRPSLKSRPILSCTTSSSALSSALVLAEMISMLSKFMTWWIALQKDISSKSMNPSGFLNGLDSELVYTISVTPSVKRITVTFRGSVNANDWITNVSMAMVDFKLPGFTKEEVRDTRKSYGRVHVGFYEYLFGKTQLGSNGSNKSKAEEIMGILTSMVEGEYKGYSVCVTGHSLG